MKILLVLAIWLAGCFSGNAFSQSAEYFVHCNETQRGSYYQCFLKPPGYTPWRFYNGISADVHNSIEESAKSFYDKWLANSIYACQTSYRLEAEVVTTTDGFKQAEEPVSKTVQMYIRRGLKDDQGVCVGVSEGYAGTTINGIRQADCTPFEGAYFSDINSQGCRQLVEKSPPAVILISENACHGNPILGPSREKVEVAVDLSDESPMPLEFRRTYRSHRVRDAQVLLFKQELLHKGDLGLGWLHNHDFNLSYTKVRNDPEGGGTLDQVRINMGDGSQRYFTRRNGGAYLSRDTLLKLTQTGGGWIFDDERNEHRYEFNNKGRITRQVFRNGWEISYTYAGIQLSKAQNQFGRFLEFLYDDSGLLSKVITSDSRSVEFEYSDKTLTSVKRGDGTSRKYVYNELGAPGMLAGVVDEYGVRYSTFTYDGDGWAVATEKNSGVDRYAFLSVSASGYDRETSISDPLGAVRKFGHRLFNNEFQYTGVNLPLASGEERFKVAISYDANGLEQISYDAGYINDTVTWNVPRRLPTSRTEAASQSEARTTNINWDPQWRSPLSISGPAGTTVYTYDGRGNPLTEESTDAMTGMVRKTQWTYYPNGLVATHTAPNGGVTGFVYDALGNLTQRTNALGHVGTYTHDAAGRVKTQTAPNGLVSTYTYDVLGRMLTSSRGGLVTTFTYRLSGEVASATLPHGHSVTYIYDGAHRLTGWSDNRGNTGTYTLDNMGNRLSEEVRNGQGQLAWRLARGINSLNQLTSVTVGTDGAPSTVAYDARAYVSSSSKMVDGAAVKTTYSRDSRGRTRTITNADFVNAWLGYNLLDDVTSVSDFKDVATGYSRDSLGNATSESSADSGSKSAQYDALGLPSSITNALGQATTITRDLLGRPTSIVHGGGGTTTLRYDQSPTSKGYLGEIEDASGLTTYERDVQGRVTSHTQKLINNDTRTLAYSYNATTGLLASTTYPGGQVLQNVYDATGQLTGLTWAGQSLVSGVTWNPLGQPVSWSWNLPSGANAIPATRSYDTAGRVTATEFSGYTYDAAGRLTNITQSLMQPASTDAQASTVNQSSVTWIAQYDKFGRITAFTKAATSGTAADPAVSTYTYDANGNRTTSSQQRAGTTTNRTYTLTANRQTGFSQTQTGASTANTSVTYQYNAAGDLLTDGLRTYQYDSQERLEKVTTGTGVDAPSTQYAHNALGQRVFKTEPLFASGSGSGSTTSGKNLNNLLADPEDQEEAEKDKGLIQTAYEFFTRLWSPGSSDAQKLGFAYVYGQDGTLLGEYGMGGSNSSGTSQYIYLPTANGPMPIAAIVNGIAYAVHSDHLNTPRKLTQADGQVAWQWAYSAFGDEQPTLGAKRFTNETTTPNTGTTPIPEVAFNLRYPGQYYDKESNLHYNYFRSYSAERGRYTQADPIGLDGGFNRFGYVDGNALGDIDPFGLQSYMRPRRPGWPDWAQPSQPNPHCATGECAAGVLPSRDTTPSIPQNFNTDPCVQEYLAQNYGNAVAKTMVPNFSALSYVPGSGTAGAAWQSTGISVATKGALVGVPFVAATAVEAAGVAGAGVAGGATPASLMAFGNAAYGFGVFASGGIAIFGAATLPFSTAANAMALAHCSCRR